MVLFEQRTNRLSLRLFIVARAKYENRWNKSTFLCDISYRYWFGSRWPKRTEGVGCENAQNRNTTTPHLHICTVITFNDDDFLPAFIRHKMQNILSDPIPSENKFSRFAGWNRLSFWFAAYAQMGACILLFPRFFFAHTEHT